MRRGQAFSRAGCFSSFFCAYCKAAMYELKVNGKVISRVAIPEIAWAQYHAVTLAVMSIKDQIAGTVDVALDNSQ